jgi:hypothetical protein
MTTVPFFTLPADLHFCIIQLLSHKEICALRETCKFFRDFVDAHGERIWRRIAVESLRRTAPCTGCRVGAWSGSPDASQDLAAAIVAQKSALGSFDDITTWTDLGVCFLYSFDLMLKHTRQFGVGSRSTKDGDGTSTAASFR